MIKDHNPRGASDVLDIPYAVFIVCGPNRIFIVKRRPNARNIVKLETGGVKGKVSRLFTATDVFDLDIERGRFPVLNSQQ
jgi:hypothetical protein